jgi:hypothetical protein
LLILRSYHCSKEFKERWSFAPFVISKGNLMTIEDLLSFRKKKDIPVIWDPQDAQNEELSNTAMEFMKITKQ